MKNIELFPREGKAIISVNPKVYSLEVVYSAAYVFLDKAYFFLDGDPEKGLMVAMQAKDEKISKKALETLAKDFGNELVNYSVYIAQAARNQAVREAIIKRALATNIEDEYCPECSMEKEIAGAAKKIKMPEEDENLYIKDPEGISAPWVPEKAKGLKKPK
ncbi:MAG: His-Xaa-Ser system protein HxsD [Candidatus Diapherotrites archaeon]|nr:His-Xaa-Ser system protein HxsD [Candidatus Diapherotrites archaeon]